MVTWLTFLLSAAFLSFSSNSWAVSLLLSFLHGTCNALGIGDTGCLSSSKPTVNATLLLLSLLEDFAKLVGFSFWCVGMTCLWHSFDKLLFLSSTEKSFVIWHVKVLKSFATWRAVVISSEDVILGVLWLMPPPWPIRDFCWRSSSTLCASFLAASCRSWILFSLSSTCCCVRKGHLLKFKFTVRMLWIRYNASKKDCSYFFLFFDHSETAKQQ